MSICDRRSILKIRDLILSVMALMLLGWSTANGQGSTIWTVDDNGPADFSNIQDAVDVALNGDTIEVKPGTYYGTGNPDQPVVDMLGKSITLVGLPSGSNRVFVDGNNNRRCLDCTSGESAGTVIESIDFRNGYADFGGGLRCLDTSPTLKDCIFDENTATSSGGGVYIEGGSPYLESCTITDNDSPYGAGLYIRESSATIAGGLVAGNQASNRGGGFRIYDASPEVSDVQIQSNQAVRGGAAHIQQNASPIFQNCLIRQNAAESLGGGMAHSTNSPAVYQNCSFIDNEATGANGGQGSGGAVYSDGSTVLFQSCSLLGNEATTYGAGVYCWYSSPVFVDTSFQNNVAGNSGGAIRTIGGTGPQLISSNLLCENMPDNIAGPWDGAGSDNCIGDSCDDDDLDGIIDACDDEVIPTRQVPSEYSTVAEAYAAANAGDIILCAPGIHYVPQDGESGLLLDTKAVTLRSEDGASATSLQAYGPSLAGRVITCQNLSNEMIIEGFTISNGYADGGFAIGGGILASNSNAQFISCIVDQNFAAYSGGGLLAMDRSQMVFEGCTISDNQSSFGGGIAATDSCELTFRNCQIIFNSCAGYGGGLYSRANLMLDSCLIADNTSIGKRGAGLLTRAGATTIQDSIFQSNIFDSGNPQFPPTSSDLQIEDGGAVSFVGSNQFDTMEAYDPSDSVAGAFRLTPGSLTSINSDVTSPDDGAMIVDIGSLASDPLLSCEGTIRQQGCLTLINSSGSLLEGSVGTFIELMESSTFQYDETAVVFPLMPSGLGLQLKEEASSQRGGLTSLGVEIIEIDTPEFDDPFSENLNATIVDMVSLDIDNDGVQELAVLFDGSPGSVAVYDVSTGAPVLIPGLGATVGNGPVDLDSGDLDGDGDDDLVVAVAEDEEVVVLTMLSNNTFATSTIVISSGVPTCAAVLDWDGNVDRDVVVGVDVPGAVEDQFQIKLDVLGIPFTGPVFDIPLAGDTNIIGNSDFPDPPTCVTGGGSEAGWGFAGGTRYGEAYHYRNGASRIDLVSIGENRITQITAKDIDASGGDGFLDIIFSSDEAELLFIVPGLGSAFDTPIPIVVDEPVEEFVALDVDADEDVDLIIASPLSASTPLLLLRNDDPAPLAGTRLGNRAWSKQAVATTIAPNQMASGTLDPKDEEDDWVLRSGGTQGLRGITGKLEQTSLIPIAPPCPADVDGDEVVSVDDLLLVIASYGGQGEGDVNDDGVVNVDDILIVLKAYGQSC